MRRRSGGTAARTLGDGMAPRRMLGLVGRRGADGEYLAAPTRDHARASLARPGRRRPALSQVYPEPHHPGSGVRGGIKASFPVGAEYDSYQVLSWATAGFAESLIRDERRRAGISPLAVRGAA